MARGWDSKSVEDQIESAKSNVITLPNPKKKSDHEVNLTRSRQGLQMIRSRVEQQIERTQSPRYLELLRSELNAIDQQLSKL